MSWAGQAAKHDADHRKAHEGYDGPSIALEIACQATVAADPGEGSLDDPALGQHDELVQFGALDDFDHPMARAGSGLRPPCSFLTRLPENAPPEREKSGAPRGARPPAPPPHPPPWTLRDGRPP